MGMRLRRAGCCLDVTDGGMLVGDCPPHLRAGGSYGNLEGVESGSSCHQYAVDIVGQRRGTADCALMMIEQSSHLIAQRPRSDRTGRTLILQAYAHTEYTASYTLRYCLFFCTV
jgi:hypothetical protein